jgi:hypothetical protein
MRPARIVQVSQAICQTWPQVQQRRRWLVRHARIAVGSARHDAFKQAEYAAHLRFPVERRDKVHLGCAWVGKTYIHIVGQKGVAKTICTIHFFKPCSSICLA